MKIRKLIGIVFLGCLICGCSLEKKQADADLFGSLKVEIINKSGSQLSDSISIKIVKQSDGSVLYKFDKLSDFKTTTFALEPGSYTVEATPTSKKIPLFNRVSFGGSCQANVSEGEVTQANLELKQKNIAVQVKYSDKFKSEYSNIAATVSSNEGALGYGSDETKVGYFETYPISVSITYTDKQGTTYKKSASYQTSSGDISYTFVFYHPSEEFNDSYYATALGKVGKDLKDELTKIISAGYKTRTYGELWTAYIIGDIRTDGTKAIWDIYSDIPNSTPPYLFTPQQSQCGSYSGEGNCYNREHCIPQSWFKESSPMVSDYLHILPTDGYVNNRRSNYPYGEVEKVSWTSKNGSKLGTPSSTLGYSGTVFEPIDAYKGDIARIFFYFVTRYAQELPKYDTNNGSTEEIFNTQALGLDKWCVDMFLRWNRNDPVSEKERLRNKQAETFQNNRNPFVDHPEFVEMIWGNGTQKSATTSHSKIIYISTK